MSEQATETETQTNEDHWSQSAPEFARGWDQVKDSATQEDFYNRVGEMRSYMGNSLRIPGEDASEDARSEFQNKLLEKVPSLMNTPDFDNPESVADLMKRMGKPEDANDYADVSGESISFADGQLAELKTMAMELGLTKKQFEAFATKVGTEAATGSQAHAEKVKAEHGKIQEAWGLAAESKYQQTVNFAKQAGAPQELVAGLENKMIDADTVMWLNTLAQGISEKSDVSFQPNNSSGNMMTPLDAKERMREMREDMEGPYQKGDPIARKRMHELMRIADPERYKDNQ